jgi:hypothetical protein
MSQKGCDAWRGGNWEWSGATRPEQTRPGRASLGRVLIVPFLFLSLLFFFDFPVFITFFSYFYNFPTNKISKKRTFQPTRGAMRGGRRGTWFCPGVCEAQRGFTRGRGEARENDMGRGEFFLCFLILAKDVQGGNWNERGRVSQRCHGGRHGVRGMRSGSGAVVGLREGRAAWWQGSREDKKRRLGFGRRKKEQG